MATGRQDLFGIRSPSDLADAILARIHDRELPAGALLDPARLSPVMEAREDQIAEALRLLEGKGVVVRTDSAWVVRHDRKAHAREVLARGEPVLLAIARLAAEHATPAEAARITSARDRLGGVSGDGSLATRAAAYRETLELVALASRSRFHVEALRQMLDETADLFIPIAGRDMQMFPRPNPDGELVRLARAIMAGDQDAAEVAMNDHLLLLARHMDALPQS